MAQQCLPQYLQKLIFIYFLLFVLVILIILYFSTMLFPKASLLYIENNDNFQYNNSDW